MSTGTTGNPDILAAVVSYLRTAMAADLGDTPASPRVWSDYAPQCPYPFAVVNEGPETYAAQTEDFAAADAWISNIATGSLQVTFYATSKAEARRLGRTAVLRLTDSRVQLQADDGRVISIFPQRIDSAVIGDIAAGEPTAFARAATFTYVQQFAEFVG